MHDSFLTVRQSETGLRKTIRNTRKADPDHTALLCGRIDVLEINQMFIQLLMELGDQSARS